MMTDFVSAEWVSSRGDDVRMVDVWPRGPRGLGTSRAR